MVVSLRLLTLAVNLCDCVGMTNDDITYRHGVRDALTGQAPRTGMPAVYYEGYQDGSEDLGVAA